MKLSSKDKKTILIELENYKQKRVIWAIINILFLSWLIVPFFIGISQLFHNADINKLINKLNYDAAFTAKEEKYIKSFIAEQKELKNLENKKTQQDSSFWLLIIPLTFVLVLFWISMQSGL